MRQIRISNQMRLWVLTGLAVCFGSVQAQDDLQEYINHPAMAKRAGNSDVIVVDLSQFSATERSATLEIKTGGSYLFVNGTLKKAQGCVVPLVNIGGGSTMEIGTMDGDLNKRAWISSNGVVCGVETIRMEGGTLRVTEGVLEGGTMQGWGGSPDYDNAVLMTSDDDVFLLESPDNYWGTWIECPIVCEASKASVTIRGMRMHTNGADFGTVRSYSDVTMSGDAWMHIELLSKDNVVRLTSAMKDWPVEVTAPQKTYNDAIVVGEDYQLTASDKEKVELAGSKTYQLRLSDNKILLGIDDLQDWIDHPGGGNGTGTEEDPITGNIGCDGVDVDGDLTFNPTLTPV